MSERNPTEHVEDAIKVIRRSASHLVNLVDGLLDIARIENGSLRIERNRVALPELLDQVVDMFRLQAAAKGLDFEYDRSPRLPGPVFTDERSEGRRVGKEGVSTGRFWLSTSH